MHKIVTYNKISETGLSLFDKEKYEISDTMENPDGAIVRSAALHDVQFSELSARLLEVSLQPVGA